MAFLVVFVLLCGLHIAGSHHDTHGDAFGLAAEMLVFLALSLLVLHLWLTGSSDRPGADSDDPGRVLGAGLAHPPPPPSFFYLGAPLRC